MSILSKDELIVDQFDGSFSTYLNVISLCRKCMSYELWDEYHDIGYK